MADFFAGVLEFLFEALLPPYGRKKKQETEDTDEIDH